ncbi:MAG: glycosyltransferase family 4 protein [Candidatus Nezhaarchaeota archaeon]|nr:glycosyltransferase family 4 protein [Candidatus Nezhaarchaeota archaeon]
MKVAFVVAGPMYPDAVGGAEIFTGMIAKSLSNLGSEVHIVAYEGVKFHNKRDNKIVWHGIKMKMPFLGRTLTFAVKALGVLLGIKPDVCIANMGHSVLPCLAYSLLVKRPIMVRMAGGEFVAAFKNRNLGLWAKIYSRFMIEMSRKCYIITLNRDAYSTFRLKKIGKKIFLIPNPIKDEFFEVKPKLDGFNIVYVGGLKASKGLHTLIKAFVEVSEKNPNARLLLVGDGPLRKTLEEMIHRLNLKGKVLITGFVLNDYIPKILEKASAFVLPSHSEGLSNSLLQAMAAGLPCIVSNIEENKYIIIDGYNGLIFELGQPKSLAAAMTRVITDKKFALKIGYNARNSVFNLRISNITKLYIQAIFDTIKDYNN